MKQRSPLKRNLVKRHAAYLAGLLDASGHAIWVTNGKSPTARLRIEVLASEPALLDGLIGRFGGYKMRKNKDSGRFNGWRVYSQDAQFLYDATEGLRFLKLYPQADRRDLLALEAGEPKMASSHWWSGWPGAYCMYCGADDPMEQAVADCWYDPCTDKWDSEEHEADVKGRGVCPIEHPDEPPKRRKNA